MTIMKKMKEMNMSNIKLPSPLELRRRGKELYPQSIIMAQRWFRATMMLYKTGRHAHLTGGFKWGDKAK
jgi:hypothetical protein